MTSKKNMDASDNANLNVNFTIVKTLVTDITYTLMDVSSWQNAICPNAAFSRLGHKNQNAVCYNFNYCFKN